MFRKVMKTFGVVVTILLVVLAVVSVGLLVKTKVKPTQVPTIFGYSLVAVLTGSMSPSIDPGDMVIVREVEPEVVKAGDVITFKSSDNIFITHRVTGVFNEDGQTIYKTKGDATNNQEEFVTKDQLIGTLSATVPYGGYAARFFRSKGGFFLFIVLPIVILVGAEFYSVLSKMKKEKKRLILEEKMNAEN